MGIVVVPTFGADPVTITGPTLDAKVSGLATEFNGSIDNDNIKAAAAIANSKLNLASISQTVAHAGTLTMTAKSLDLAKSADIASATTTTIWATDGNYAHITGTTTITSFGTAAQAGASRTITFDGILTLTHNSTSLILPGAANITTAAGDRAIVVAETTANARVIAYIKADGTAVVSNSFTPSVTNALSGSQLQQIFTKSAATTSNATTIPNDNTKPQSGEGTALSALDTAITPSNASNRLLIEVLINVSHSVGGYCIGALFQDAGADSLAAETTYVNITQATQLLILRYEMAAGTTSATTFKVRYGPTAGTMYINAQSDGTGQLGGVVFSSMKITEIKA